jgi:uncharacterized membrane protein
VVFLKIRRIAFIAFIAALYAGLTVALQPISYGPIQVRVSEALTILPIFYAEAVPGLFLGCLIANIFGGFGIYDIVFGSLLTLLAAFSTRALRRKPYLAFIPPILFNGLGVPAYLTFLTGVPYWVLAAQITVGETVAVAGIGSFVYLALSRAARSEQAELV